MLPHIHGSALLGQLMVIARGGLAIGDTGGIPGGPTGLGWSKIPAHSAHQTALPSNIAGTYVILCYTEHILLNLFPKAI